MADVDNDSIPAGRRLGSGERRLGFHENDAGNSTAPAFDTMTVALVSLIGLLLFVILVVISLWLLRRVWKRRFERRSVVFPSDGAVTPQQVLPQLQQQVEAQQEVGKDWIRDRQRLIRKRLKTIETWLITKRVKEHDDRHCKMLLESSCHNPGTVDSGPGRHENRPQETCTCSFSSSQLSTDSSSDSSQTSENETTNDTRSILVSSDDETTASAPNHNECPICMSGFEVGDVVSWSSSQACSHYFHHECIKQWLVENVGCPICRETYLPIDEVATGTADFTEATLSKPGISSQEKLAAILKSTTGQQILLNLKCAYDRQSSEMSVCVRHGLVGGLGRRRSGRDGRTGQDDRCEPSDRYKQSDRHKKSERYNPSDSK